MPPTDAEREFPLADIIQLLGGQLRESMRRHEASDEDDLLALKECTVELGLTWDKKGEAGIDFKVVKLGGGLDKTNTQTISVTLQPASQGVTVDEVPLVVGLRADTDQS